MVHTLTVRQIAAIAARIADDALYDLPYAAEGGEAEAAGTTDWDDGTHTAEISWTCTAHGTWDDTTGCHDPLDIRLDITAAELLDWDDDGTRATDVTDPATVRAIERAAGAMLAP